MVTLLIGARDMMVEGMRGDLRAKVIDPFDPKLRQYLITSMGSLPIEVLRILFLDGARRLLADEQLQHGTLAQLAIYPRTIFQRALELNAAGIILVHNHPSGDPSPSEEDIAATQRLDQIGRALDVVVLDHIVVTSACAHHIANRETVSVQSTKDMSFTLRSSENGPPHARDAVDYARATMRRRILRRQLIGAEELFGEPAWEMLIDLFIHEGEGRPLSTSDLCVTSTIPMSSALRLVQKLCDAGLVDRTPDLMDARRSFVRLQPATSHRLRAYFSEAPE